MQIAKHSVVTLEYTLTAPDGEVLDSSKGGQPLAYVHGTEALVPGLERELEGKRKGDRFDVHVAPDDGYGAREEHLVHDVTRAQLPPGLELEVGLQLQAKGPDGDLIVTIVALSGELVTLDGNHPLAGMELHFTGEVVDVRAASREELAHGHVHGQGGHAH
ncbi:MAG: peptidylprolyl isomerase [Planctomycetes bacterium]|nr:peptidylprolyl isomerase [Planctomycetota bacterium]